MTKRKVSTGRPKNMLTPEVIASATKRARQGKERVIERALNIVADPKREERLKERKCVVCFYLQWGNLCGQAFTSWTCFGCGYLGMHRNTNTPRICMACSAKHNICVECNGDLDIRIPTKALRPSR